MPFKGTEEAVLADVPASIPLTVTVTEAKGISVTVSLAERLTGHGYSVAPHLPARLVSDEGHLAEVVARLREASIHAVLVIGGDASHPVGRFPDAFSLLRSLENMGRPFKDVAIAGYPEGRAGIPDQALELALKQKSPYATRIVTQMCFNATTTSEWARDISCAGVELPVHVGLPGPVNRQKLIRISSRLGLGQSARFLQKQRSLLWRFLLPGAYGPTKLARSLETSASNARTEIRGLHIFTFNELHQTEKWRRELLDASQSAAGTWRRGRT
ncbi:MAG: 5,10-methylenetetrahydrofolate reductase [Propionibacteriales bacterium]|nr:5,10-methylenetetrahydrofolate reductase [Propionibacteriales bacterium]